jgi:Gpi18-like mannosyltransferase
MHNERGASQPDERANLLQRGLWYAFQVFLALRLGTLAWVIVLSLVGGRALSEPDVLCKSSVLLESDLSPAVGLGSWLRWDTNCYLIIAEHGYTAQPGLTVWPPFYPFLIDLFSFVIKPPVLAALVLSSLAAWLAFVLLYLLIAESHDETTAKNTLFLYAIYPVGFFLVAGYTESLFLALVVGSFLLARKRVWSGAGILAALAALTRNQGIVLSAVLLWEGWLQYRAAKGLPPGAILKVLLSASLPFLALAGFALYVHNRLDAEWPWQTLAALWGQYSGFPWEGIVGSTKQLLTLPFSQDLYWLPTTVLDLFLAIFIPMILIRQRRSIRSSEEIYAWLILIIALVKLGPDGTLVSFSRYMLAAFPIFAAISPVMVNRYRRLALFAVCLIAQAILLSMFYYWSWAG